MQVLVIANGEAVDPERLRQAAALADLVIAADGGTRHGLRHGLLPDVVVGDLDSLAAEHQEELEADGAQLVRHPPDKDQTDLELALRLARNRGAERIVVLGAAGGRLDMTVANLLLLADPELQGVAIEVWHGSQTASVLRPPGGALAGKVGDTVSLIPLGGRAAGIVTRGLAFALEDGALEVGPARGVSNRISDAHPAIELQSGALLIVHTPASKASADQKLANDRGRE